ncbi:GlcNAc transferase [Tieghemostelium lacteum]|uniref:GlcNAc transferase n=1 Tax=Tieghemostelium lacteum TaxID=361077 RepID=A0A151ZAL3_TIELA|nr:GlcNAc transferase [Tieghemostelium lacteum]|eukprot:KYQ90934.1 GlcNAc transferase [Tieghemostelium lacteum]
MSCKVCPYCGNELNKSEHNHIENNNNNNNSNNQINNSQGIVKWRKILYEKQAYSDNYTDETFLVGLVQNANFIKYDFWTVVMDSFTVSQQISAVILFVILFFHALRQTLTLPVLLSMGVVLLVAGYIVISFIDPTSNFESIKDSILHVILLFGTVYALSPVLRTLTNSFSDDTIWALTFILLLASLFFHDYGYTNNESTKFSAPVSLNAAIFASVLLGSRLTSNIHVFVLISYAIEIFALFPIVRHHLKRHSLEMHVGLTIILCTTCGTLLMGLNTLLALVYIGIINVITFVCPIWLIFIQKYKNEINGPWDEASVTSQSAAENW